MSEILIRSLDLETADMDPPASMIEHGWTDLWFNPETKEYRIEEPHSILFKPSGPMKPEVIAVHHLTDAMLADKNPCTDGDIDLLLRLNSPRILVAHHAAFEQKWLTDEHRGVDTYWVCTEKVARHCYEEAPGFSLQTLRYWLGLDLDPALAMPPHRAGPDSYVAAHVFARMLQTETVNQMIKWTMSPRRYPTCPLGKHKGQKWCDVPHKYLTWMVGAGNDIEEDVKQAARDELQGRYGR